MGKLRMKLFSSSESFMANVPWCSSANVRESVKPRPVPEVAPGSLFLYWINDLKIFSRIFMGMTSPSLATETTGCLFAVHRWRLARLDIMNIWFCAATIMLGGSTMDVPIQRDNGIRLEENSRSRIT